MQKQNKGLAIPQPTATDEAIEDFFKSPSQRKLENTLQSIDDTLKRIESILQNTTVLSVSSSKTDAYNLVIKDCKKG